MVDKTILHLVLALSVQMSVTHSQTPDISAIFPAILEGERQSLQEPCDDTSDHTEFDFIIIGAGASGCVVANRLTEEENWKVLLLEAGGEETAIMDIPNLSAMYMPDNFWFYKTPPSETRYKAFEGQQVTYMTGKAMGGGTAVNWMFNVRGNRNDFDNWEKMGNPGWGYKDVLPYFKKLENIQIPELRDSEYHSTEGNIKISYPTYRSKLGSIFIDAGKELGYFEVDYNGENQTGFSLLQTTTADGSRWSASHGYLHPIRDRQNLFVKKRAIVTKILVNETSNTAYGVSFTKGGNNYTVLARKEVILTAGSIKSAQLLMLSGIGPQEHLKEFGIDVIKDLKVGYNLMEHPDFLGLTFLMNETTDPSRSEIINDLKYFQEYWVNKSGPLTSTSFTHAIAFVELQNTSSYQRDWPNSAIILLSPPFVENSDDALRYGSTKEVADEYFGPISDVPTFRASFIPLKIKSRGRVTLRDDSAFSSPVYDPNILSEEEDIELAIAAIRKAIELTETEPFQSVGAKLYDKPVPFCKDIEFNTDDYWRCALLQMSYPLYHSSGSCKMGPSTDETAVVGPDLKVHGIERLRVIGTAIFPVIVSSNPMNPAYMVAEKGADLIKAEHLQ